MRELLAATLASFFLVSSSATATIEGYLEAVELAKAERYSEARELFARQEPLFEENPIYLNRTRVWIALTALASEEDSVQIRAKLVEILCETLTPEEQSELRSPGATLECEASQGSPSGPVSQLDADMTTAALAALGTIHWRERNYLFSLRLLALASQRAARISSVVSDHAAARQSLTKTPTGTLQEAAAKATIAEHLASREIFEEVLRKSESPSPETIKDSPAMRNMIQAKQAGIMADTRKRVAKGLPSAVRDDASLSLEELAQLSGQRQALEQLVRLACEHPELLESIPRNNFDRIFEKGGESAYGRELKTLFLRVQTEGVEDCSDDALAKQWGVARELTAEEQRAEWQAEKEAERRAREQQRRLSRAAANEPGSFYRVSEKVVCSYSNPAVSSVGEVERSTRQSLAAFLESSRGQRFESFQMVNRGVLAAINRFLDQSGVLREMSEEFDLASGQRRPFVRRLAYCADALDLGGRFTEALNTLLIKRPYFVEPHLKEVIATDRRLRESAQFDDPMRGTQDTLEHWVLGTFYFRDGQAEKALPHLLQAFDKMTPSALFETSPEVAYSAYMSQLAFLRDAITALRETNQSAEVIQPRIAQLRKAMDEAHSRMERANPLQLAGDSVQTTGVRQEGSSATSPPGLAALLALVESTIRSSGVELPSALKERPRFSQEDVLGTLLERNYHLRNSHALARLAIVQLELDARNPRSAREHLSEVDHFMMANNGWMSPRVLAYREYTAARLFEDERDLASATKAYEDAILGWYFNPHSMLEILDSPLGETSEILERATRAALSREEYERAFAYIELARHADWDRGELYGAYSAAELRAEDERLRGEFSRLRAAGRRSARDRGEEAAFELGVARGTEAAQRSKRGDLSAVLTLLVELEPLARWIPSYELGEFVATCVAQANRHQALRFQSERAQFLAREVGTSASPASRKGGRMDAARALGMASEVRTKLPKDTLLLSMWMGRERTYIFAADSRDVRAHVADSQELNGMVQLFDNGARQYLARHGHALYEQIAAPYVHREYSRLVIISNGTLQNTPFSALSTHPSEREWLGDKYFIRSLPRAAQFAASGSGEARSHKLLALDGSKVPSREKLKAAEQEIDAALSHFAGRRVIPQDLTKANVIDLLPKYSLVHFAGHSELNPHVPDYSSMQLYDDRLYLAELRALSLDSVDLMVLSSCESGENLPVLYGDQFSSLQESLHEAGVRSVVATLHKVEDATSALLMRRFYQALSEGKPKDEALQEAQRFAREQGSDSSNHWAAFVLSGSNAPVR